LQRIVIAKMVDAGERDGLKKEAAIEHAMSHFRISRRAVFDAIKSYRGGNSQT
jgi:hypothetical protein